MVTDDANNAKTLLQKIEKNTKTQVTANYSRDLTRIHVNAHDASEPNEHQARGYLSVCVWVVVRGREEHREKQKSNKSLAVPRSRWESWWWLMGSLIDEVAFSVFRCFAFICLLSSHNTHTHTRERDIDRSIPIYLSIESDEEIEIWPVRSTASR